MIVSKEERPAATTCAAYTYELTSRNVDEEEGMGYTTYGIRALNRGGEEVAAFSDVNTSRDFVSGIVEKCNKYKVDPLHLEDILIDEIG